MKKLLFGLFLLMSFCIPLGMANGNNISAPKFNSEWNIDGQVYRVCWGLPQHARWNTGAASSDIVYSYYGDLMPVNVNLSNLSQLLGVLTARSNPEKCPILCEEGYIYDSDTISCNPDPSWSSSCNPGYLKINGNCMLAQNEITINDDICNHIAPNNAHYVSGTETVYLVADGTYTAPVCSWECDEGFTNLNGLCYSNPSQVSCEVEYYNRAQSEDVTAILTGCTSQITGTEMTHTFTENGSYTFNFQDYFGNTGSVTATVDWISCKTNEFNGELNSCNIENVCNVNSYTSQNVIQTYVNCYDTGITSIAAGTFLKLVNVDSISISSNAENISVSKDAFKGLNKIKNISLYSYRDNPGIYELPEGVFDGLTTLESLSISTVDYPEHLFSGLTSIRYMYLNPYNTGIINLSEGLFSGLTTLESLSVGATDFPQHIFNGLSNLKQLDIGYGYTGDIAPVGGNLPLGLFSGLDSLESLTVHISSIPVGIFADLPNLKYLTLSEIGTIQSSLLDGLNNLENLNIGNYRTGNYGNTNIEEGILSNLNKLNYLSIYGVRNIPQLSNNILNITGNINISDFETISENAFNNMPGLKSISLGNYDYRGYNYGQITLSENLFAGLSNLEQLSLYISGLNNLPNNIFNGLISLKNLSINNANITTLNINQFSGLTNLEYLDINSNNIYLLPMGIFNRLNNLKSINLRNNKLETLELGLFSGLTNFESLNIMDNKLASLETGVFDGLNALKSIDLSYNKISNIPLGLFSGLSNLQSISLVSNQIPFLPDGVFSGLNNLSNLNLQYNCFSQSSLLNIPYYKYKYVNNQKLCFVSSYNPSKDLGTTGTVTVSLGLTGDETLFNNYSGYFILPDDVVLTENGNGEFDISNYEGDSLLYSNIPYYVGTGYVHYPVNGKVPYSVDRIE